MHARCPDRCPDRHVSHATAEHRGRALHVPPPYAYEEIEATFRRTVLGTEAAHQLARERALLAPEGFFGEVGQLTVLSSHRCRAEPAGTKMSPPFVSSPCRPLVPAATAPPCSRPR